MWLLESDVFQDGRKWLRPGRVYVFGRTAENTTIVISDKTISRQHITIHVGEVADGDGGNMHARSQVTIEEMNSKKGTLLNGAQIRGETVVLAEPVNELILGACPHPLRIVWRPVVLSLSFTKKEIEAGSWQTLRDSLEQLDIKYIGTYDQLATHVVSKKRNTSKTLQALVNGKPIVSDSFITAIVEAATVPDDADDGTPSALESNFNEAWPNPVNYLPPRGDEPTERPPADYAPDGRRQDVFAGYTFVFYNQKQHDNLAPVIQWGKGKAFFKEVVEGVTEVDDFVRYVKEVAGERGTGSLDDDCEGKRVVVVRYPPGKGDDVEWWTNFYTSFARHLDHRPPDQKEFLEAILACDASLLRRRLEEDTQPTSTANPTQKAQLGLEDRMQVDQPDKEKEEPTPPRRRARAGGRSRFKGFDFDSDSDEDKSMTDVPAAAAAAAAAAARKATQPAAEIPASQDSQSLFVSQRQEPVDDDFSEQESRPTTTTTRSSRSQPKPTRKRALSPLPEHDVSELLDAIVPTATAAKRRRIEAGQPAIPEPTPEPEEPAAVDDDKVSDSPKGKGKKEAKGTGKKAKKRGDDPIIELARQKREEAEALAAAERQALLDAAGDDEIDYAAIRRLHIIEEFDVRMPNRDRNSDDEEEEEEEEEEEGYANASGGRRGGRTREQDIADGRWNPRWNGRQNFKKFRKQKAGVSDAAAASDQQQRRPLITLEEVKPKEYGIGDDYWLEDTNTGSNSRRNTQTQTQGQGGQSQSQGPRGSQNAAAADNRSRDLPTRRMLMAVDSSDSDADSGDDDNNGIPRSPPPPYSETPTATAEPSRSRAAKAAEKAAAARRAQQTAATATTATQSEVSSGSGAGSKHGAPASGSEQPAAKRAKRTGSRRMFEIKDSDEDSDESDDGLKFRFGRRK
ncbi:DNA damage response protein RcaA [Copromyces sp. CBS 386.78]|nr:DNA damage response protein RcaA [Copromyces sp. CBS 386.78]